LDEIEGGPGCGSGNFWGGGSSGMTTQPQIQSIGITEVSLEVNVFDKIREIVSGTILKINVYFMILVCKSLYIMRDLCFLLMSIIWWNVDLDSSRILYSATTSGFHEDDC